MLAVVPLLLAALGSSAVPIPLVNNNNNDDDNNGINNIKELGQLRESFKSDGCHLGDIPLHGLSATPFYMAESNGFNFTFNVCAELGCATFSASSGCQSRGDNSAGIYLGSALTQTVRPAGEKGQKGVVFDYDGGADGRKMSVKFLCGTPTGTWNVTETTPMVYEFATFSDSFAACIASEA